MNLWGDTETFCVVPIKHGSYRYAEEAEVMLFSYAIDDGPVRVWDLTAGELCPEELRAAAHNPDCLVWFQNLDKFDGPVLAHAFPWFDAAVPLERRRDTMVQAYCHGLPGNLEMMGAALGLPAEMRKTGGKRLIHLFCKPQKDGSRNDRHSHPAEWEEFKAYAGQDIVAMRECSKRMPMWNYKGKQLDLWFMDQRTNARGMQMDVELAQACVEARELSRLKMSKRTQELTDNVVAAATQGDAMMAFILATYGIDLPDMQADTIQRRAYDESLPAELRELLLVRLESVTTSVAKYGALLKGVSSDGRLRGCMQFRGAARTGRVGHRLFQPGNMPRPNMPYSEIAWGIVLIKLRAAHLVFDNVMRVASNAIRGAIIAGPGKKLVVADLSNIEGRFAAWLAGEDWKLQAFRDFDAGISPDLYIMAYAKAFNVDPKSVDKKTIRGYEQRQMGKVMELMLQYGGGVGAFITGAATYGIDLTAMADGVWDTLPIAVRNEAEGFLEWLYEDANNAYVKVLEKVNEQVQGGEIEIEVGSVLLDDAAETRERRKLKARLGLTEKVFIACDSLKRLWRAAHSRMSSYWKELEEFIREAIGNPGVTFEARRLKIRRDGAWLRIALPSGRALCYPQPKWDYVQETPLADGTVKKKRFDGFSYTGVDQYTRKWQRISSYGGKVFENVTQAGSCDVLLESGPLIEQAGFEPVLSVHDEWVTEVPLDKPGLDHECLAELMCSDVNGWHDGLPLAAAGFTTDRYKKED